MPGKAFDLSFEMPEPDVGIMTFNRCVAVDQWEAMGRPDILEKNCHSTCPKSMIVTTEMYNPNMKVDILAIPPRRGPRRRVLQVAVQHARPRTTRSTCRSRSPRSPSACPTDPQRPGDGPDIVLIGTRTRGEVEPMDIPESFAGGADVTGKRVVITGAAGVSAGCSPTRSRTAAPASCSWRGPSPT